MLVLDDRSFHSDRRITLTDVCLITVAYSPRTQLYTKVSLLHRSSSTFIDRQYGTYFTQMYEFYLVICVSSHVSLNIGAKKLRGTHSSHLLLAPSSHKW